MDARRKEAGRRAPGRTGQGEPVPGWIPPMLARPGPLPPAGSGWALEMKWDGIRALAYVTGGEARLLSRTGENITAAYPELRGLAPALAGQQAVLDGEIVALREDGWPGFELLQQRIHVRSPSAARRLAAATPVTYLVFDLLYLNGQSLLNAPYQQRRARLESLALDGPHWQTPPSFTRAEGEDLLGIARQHGLEGVVAKRLDSRYEPGRRTGSWVKTKIVRHQEVVVGGWQPGEGGRAGQIGSLLVGVHDAGGLAFAGHVGTGFSQRALRLLAQRLAPLRRATSPFTTPVPAPQARTASWVEPVLVIEVAYTGWTRAGRLRAPSYRGLRPDKDPAQVTREP
jgi:bifunctional non-homologous end joining protein LigD